MKEYKIKGTYIVKEKGCTKSIEWEVNGKKQGLPKSLEHWIARDYLQRLFYKEGV